MKRIALLVCSLVLWGCTYRAVLVPAAGARQVNETVAVAELEGVRAYVNGSAWRGDPLDLSDVMSPVLLVVENAGPHPLRLAYRDFTLVGGSGMRYAALAPLQGESQLPTSARERSEQGQLVLATYPVAQPLVAPRASYQNFYVAPHYGYYYPGYPVWGSAFPYAPYGWGPYYWPQPLPTEEMLAEALPEGVLQPGGRIDGFVFFQGVTNRESSVRFEMRLVDARTNEHLGVLAVPMLVQRGY